MSTIGSHANRLIEQYFSIFEDYKLEFQSPNCVSYHYTFVIKKIIGLKNISRSVIKVIFSLKLETSPFALVYQIQSQLMQFKAGQLNSVWKLICTELRLFISHLEI
jgi:hypothetical protein